MNTVFQGTHDMFTLRALAFSSCFAFGIALVTTTVSGSADSGARHDCGPAFTINDLELRATFAKLDNNRGPEFAQVCSTYRNVTGNFNRDKAGAN